MYSPVHLIWFCHQPFFIPDDEIVWRINSSYEPIIDAFVERELPLTMGISGGLLERIFDLKPSFVDWLRDLIAQRKLSILGTAYYHPLLPSLVEPWALTHILEDSRVRSALELPTLNILWPTELAWSMQVGSLAADAGYGAVIIDSTCRDLVDTYPTWSLNEDRLIRSYGQKDRARRPSRIRISNWGPEGLQLIARSLSEYYRDFGSFMR